MRLLYERHTVMRDYVLQGMPTDQRRMSLFGNVSNLELVKRFLCKDLLNLYEACYFIYTQPICLVTLYTHNLSGVNRGYSVGYH